MKKLFISAMFIGTLVTGVYADDKAKNFDDKDGVSYTVLNRFQADFRDAKNVVWTVNGNVQKADFILGNVKKTVFYNLSGDYMGTTQRVDYSAIDAKAKKEIATRYKDYAVAEVIELQTEDAVQHFVDLKGAKDEILVRVAPTSTVYFFQQVK